MGEPTAHAHQWYDAARHALMVHPRPTPSLPVSPLAHPHVQSGAVWARLPVPSGRSALRWRPAGRAQAERRRIRITVALAASKSFHVKHTPDRQRRGRSCRSCQSSPRGAGTSRPTFTELDPLASARTRFVELMKSALAGVSRQGSVSRETSLSPIASGRATKTGAAGWAAGTCSRLRMGGPCPSGWGGERTSPTARVTSTGHRTESGAARTGTRVVAVRLESHVVDGDRDP